MDGVRIRPSKKAKIAEKSAKHRVGGTAPSSRQTAVQELRDQRSKLEKLVEVHRRLSREFPGSQGIKDLERDIQSAKDRIIVLETALAVGDFSEV